MTEIVDTNMQEMAVDQALMALFESEEDALCADCPLTGLTQAAEARKKVFQPFLPEEAQPESTSKISMVDHDIALKCLSRYRRGVCEQPAPEGAREIL